MSKRTEFYLQLGYTANSVLLTHPLTLEFGELYLQAEHF